MDTFAGKIVENLCGWVDLRRRGLAGYQSEEEAPTAFTVSLDETRNENHGSLAASQVCCYCQGNGPR